MGVLKDEENGLPDPRRGINMGMLFLAHGQIRQSYGMPSLSYNWPSVHLVFSLLLPIAPFLPVLTGLLNWRNEL